MCHVKSENLIVERVLQNLVGFYQGDVGYNEAYRLPLTHVYKAEDHAARIANESRKAARKKTHD